MIAAGKRPMKSPQFQAEFLDGEALLFTQSGATIIHCNATALMVWQLCTGSRTIDDIVSLLRAAYPDDVDVLHRDVYATLLQLSDNNAVEWI